MNFQNFNLLSADSSMINMSTIQLGDFGAPNILFPSEADLPPYTTVAESVLPMQVDCVAWCRQLKWVVAVGAYQLDTSGSQRVGRVYLIYLKPNPDAGFNDEPMTTSVCEEVMTGGVLDLKWEPIQENLLAVATSNSVIVFQRDAENGLPILEKYKELNFESDTMSLYVHWMSSTQLCMGDSLGNFRILEFTPNGPLICTHVKKLHEYLVWVVHYNPKTDTFYTGADDGKFLTFYQKDLEDTSRHLGKKFEVGVTSITTYKEYVALGSYDDNLRIYVQTPGDNKPCLSLKSMIGLGGAVWRTQWIPEDIFNPMFDTETNLILGAACARNGIHFIRINKVTWNAEVVLSCTQHVGPLAYGFDVKANPETQTLTVASCYFDSHIFHVWDIRKAVLGLN